MLTIEPTPSSAPKASWLRRWPTASSAIERRLDQLAAAHPSPSPPGVGAGHAAWPTPGGRLLGSFVRRSRALRWQASAARRALAYERELPALLEAVAAQLRAGASVAQALVATAPAATASGLDVHWRGVVADAPVVGVEAALARWTEVAGAIPSVRLAAGALSLAVATGGSAARAVDGVASTLRARLALAEEVRALSSQARASATVIGLAPLAFGAVAGLGDRRIIEFYTSPPGAILLLLGLGLDAAGAWWMQRLCRLAP